MLGELPRSQSPRIGDISTNKGLTMTLVAILEGDTAPTIKEGLDIVQIRSEILNTSELKRDWENIVRRFGGSQSEDMKEIPVGEYRGFRLWNVSDCVLDAMYNLGQEDHKICNSAILWAIPQVADGSGEFEFQEKTFIRFWIQSVADALVKKINPNFRGYVSHSDTDYVYGKIVETLAIADREGVARPSAQKILLDWIEGDWAPIYKY